MKSRKDQMKSRKGLRRRYGRARGKGSQGGRESVGDTKVVVEKRHPDGSLDFSEPQPPSEWIHGVWDSQIHKMYFREHPEKETMAWDDYFAWLKSKGWHVRKKTW
jgi:hypothetical protein